MPLIYIVKLINIFAPQTGLKDNYILGMLIVKYYKSNNSEITTVLFNT